MVPKISTKAAPDTRGCGAGFEVADAIALLRLDDLYIECFEIKDVKARGPAARVTSPRYFAAGLHGSD